MRSLFTAICLFIISASVSAAEITFLDNPTWASVLEKAKKENKMIFLDGYATWCGPCKSMDAETYKNQAVADYYNANFINVKYDMEKGEGKTLSEKYMVTAYPYLMFINAEGTILHKAVGFKEANDFVTLGKNAKDPNTQYYTLKKKALELSNAQFLKFAEQAAAFEDEDFDQLGSDYLAKQADILGNNDLIDLIMGPIDMLPDEKTLAYLAKSEAKITTSGKYTKADFEERIIGLTIDYAISDKTQGDAEKLDFDKVKTILDKYIPLKAFFVLHYFKAQYGLDNDKIDDAIISLGLLIENTPSKVTIDQICNAMMNMGPILLEKAKLDPILKKFEAIQFETKVAYMKDFVKAIIYIKAKELDKFKAIANKMILDVNTPENVKEDIKSALARMNEKP
ncbi:thioredoxin family protein [Pedobacter frigiditerrae]|uniref:thioredoxin family protein n=1 Tax=Pedobacter frigiditerrae TaxID=2530452 RepID=UPI002930C58A|nr:thioredoxin family protein [Pedobacter frigiditerrae]